MKRVFAILKSTPEEVFLLGEGNLLGDEIPPAEGGMLDLLNELEIANPKIQLDNGNIVWGCQCWWGSIEKLESKVGGRIVRLVDIEGNSIG